MKTFRIPLLLSLLIAATGCSKPAPDADTGDSQASAAATTAANDNGQAEPVELAPGLSMRILRQGGGKTAAAGQIAIVHYTGWLYDDAAADKRGQKFDSSVDRDQYFQFALGAGRVIRGWDQGVVGMQEGEKRELTIAPELAYGERGAGNVIPPGATLVFEVQLVRVQDVQPDIQLPESPAAQ
ncbi:MAG: hypothetical protein BMS9Abin32_229 [Gammaproteobacteria bacterium]|nr:MAG: hypothetical protein BMS9Abin32_229 [Gammaproteobacteria bacterium]